MDSKIIVTGGSGLLGSALKRELGDEHIYASRKQVDLTDSAQTDDFLSINREVSDTIIHCAAKVGGVKANSDDNIGFFQDNYIINTNILEKAYKWEYKNFVSILSTCVFPDKIEYPLIASRINDGPPHNSNYGYAYSKRLLGYMTNTFGNMLDDSNWFSIIPTNIYGKNDNFNLDDSHIIPALIRKGYEASVSGEDFVIWGDGEPLRQFIYSEDLADVICWTIDNWSGDIPFMAVNEKEHSIKDVVNIIADRFSIHDKVKYDTSKPKGQHRKPAVSDIEKSFEFTPLEEGINKTIDWFIENYDTARK